MPLDGEMTVEVRYGEQGGCLPLYVVEGNGPSLMGRDCLRQIRLDCMEEHWHGFYGGQLKQGKSPTIDKYPEVFKEGLGKMSTFEASLYLKPRSRLKFVKARPHPFAMKQAVERDPGYIGSEELGIIEKVTQSQWEAPVVPKGGW